MITELRLDKVFNYGDDNTLPREVDILCFHQCAILTFYKLCILVLAKTGIIHFHHFITNIMYM